MKLHRLLTATAAAALMAAAAYAQTAETPAAPAAEPAAEAAAAPAAEAAAPAAAAASASAEIPPLAQPSYKPVAAKGDLVATLKASGQFSTFVKALDKTNLTTVLENYSNLTVFAPTDAAFAALPDGEMDRLMKTENAPELQGLLVYHIVNAPVDSTRIKGALGPVQTVAGTELMLDGTTRQFKANSANILQADVRASNGVLHVVDHVLSAKDPVIAQAKAKVAAQKAAAAAVDAANAAAQAQAQGESAPVS